MIRSEEPSSAYDQRTTTTGRCGGRTYAVSVYPKIREPYVLLEVNRKAIRKYASDVPFAHDLLRPKQIVRMYLQCNPHQDKHVVVQVIGVSFATQGHPEYFRTSLALDQSGEVTYPSGPEGEPYEQWESDLR